MAPLPEEVTPVATGRSEPSETVFGEQSLPPVEPNVWEPPPEALEPKDTVEIITIQLQESTRVSFELQPETVPSEQDKTVVATTAPFEATAVEPPPPVEKTAAEHGESAETFPAPEPLAVTPRTAQGESPEEAVSLEEAVAAPVSPPEIAVIDETALKSEEMGSVESEIPPVEAEARPTPTVEPALEPESADVAAVAEPPAETEAVPASADLESEVETEVPTEPAVLPESAAIDDLDSETDVPGETATRPVKAEPSATVEAGGHADPAQLSLLNPEPALDQSNVMKSD
jgi:nicotinate-nucleotide--dimethylbenzimidazole phosphoribosyltransferase